jgi:hypothetical protein
MKRITVLTSYVEENDELGTSYQSLLAQRFERRRCPDATGVFANHLDSPNACVIEGAEVTDDVYAQILADPDFGENSIIAVEDI